MPTLRKTAEQVFDQIDFLGGNVAVYADAFLLFEKGTQVAGMDLQAVGDFLDGQPAVEMSENILFRILYHRDVFQGLHRFFRRGFYVPYHQRQLQLGVPYD